MLAAQIVAGGALQDDQEVLVVTLVNSAVENFNQRVDAFIEAAGLLPHLGYRVRTLHGLAHDIVRERPALVSLADNFQIVDEREADSIRQDAARAWLQVHPYELDDYLDPELDEGRHDWLRREQLPELVGGVALSLIRTAKDMQLTPERLRLRLDQLPLPLPLAEMGCQIYEDYQRALVYRGAVDFDDLIRLALQALESDPAYLERLRQRWPYILEDEAQDSSRLQEHILAAAQRSKRQLGAGWRPQPGHLRDLHHRQSPVPDRFYGSTGCHQAPAAQLRAFDPQHHRPGELPGATGRSRSTRWKPPGMPCIARPRSSQPHPAIRSPTRRMTPPRFT